MDSEAESETVEMFETRGTFRVKTAKSPYISFAKLAAKNCVHSRAEKVHSVSQSDICSRFEPPGEAFYKTIAREGRFQPE